MTDTLLPAQLVDAARKVLDANRAAGRRIAVAESCTGGLVAAALTEIAGSSDVFETGFVTYSNESKMEPLKVSLDVLETFGSVSIAVAWGMRSEEHTSELQSLMRISYAVFCLKKKKKIQTQSNMNI